MGNGCGATYVMQLEKKSLAILLIGIKYLFKKTYWKKWHFVPLDTADLLVCCVQKSYQKYLDTADL